MMRTGIPWRDLPSEFPPWQTVYHHFNRWSKSGLLMRILRRLRELPIDPGERDVTRWHIDSTVVRANKAAAGAGKRRPEEPSDHDLGRSQEHFPARLSSSVRIGTNLLTAERDRTVGVEAQGNALDCDAVRQAQHRGREYDLSRFFRDLLALPIQTTQTPVSDSGKCLIILVGRDKCRLLFVLIQLADTLLWIRYATTAGGTSCLIRPSTSAPCHPLTV